MKYKLYYDNDIEYKDFNSQLELENYICKLYEKNRIITHIKDENGYDIGFIDSLFKKTEGKK